MERMSAVPKIACFVALIFLANLVLHPVVVWSTSVTITGDTATLTSSPSSQNEGKSALGTSGQCKIHQPPQSLQVFQQNISTLISAINDLTSGAKCASPISGSEDSWIQGMEKVMAGTNVKRTIDRMVSRGTDLGKKLTAMRFFLRADNLAVPKYLLKNEEILEQIHLDILRAGSEVGSKCGNSYTFTTDVELQNSIYTTSGKDVQDVLDDMESNYQILTEFMRDLALGAEGASVSERLVPIAPIGFDEEIRQLYTQENFNACEQAQSETKLAMKDIKKAFTAGWQYKDAIQVWKEAIGLLLYRGTTLLGGTKNAQREKEIDSIVARHAGGISRSGKLASDQKKQQSGQTIHDRSVWEHVRSAIDRIEFSGQSPSSDRVSFFLNETSSFLQSFSEKSTTTQQGAFVQPSPGLETQTENGDFVFTPPQLQDIDEELLSVIALADSLNDNYEKTLSTVQTPPDNRQAFDIAPLVQAIHTLTKMTKLSEKNMAKACDHLGKQAVNVEPNSCADVQKNILSF